MTRSGGAHLLSLLLLTLFISSLFLVAVPIPRVYATTVTRTFYVEEQDGTIVKNADGAYSVAHDAATGAVASTASFITVGQRNTTYGGVLSYQIHRAYLFFDTSAISDAATLTAANLSLYYNGDDSAQDFNITVQNGQPTYPHYPLESGDYLYSHYAGAGGQLNTSSWGAGWNVIPLNATGLSWVVLDGLTKLCLRSSRDINSEPPTYASNEYVSFRSHEYGVFTPTLTVTYTFTGISMYFYGVYDEDGVDFAGNVTVTLWYEYQSPDTFTLDDYYTLDVEVIPVYFTWNVSMTSNQTRTYYLHSSDTLSFYLFIPSEPINLYLFDLVDLYGVSNGYVESSGNVNGTERVFERQPASTANSVPFYMGWSSKYNIRVRCDQGTFLWGTFTALAVQTQIILIPSGVFPTAYYGLNTTVTAARLNDTHLQVNYSDPTETTDWLNVTFYYKSGYTMANAYSVNSTGVVQTVNWYGATATTDYLAKARASKNGTLHTWSFSLPQNRTATHVWDGLFDSIGTLPFSPANLIGLFIVLCVFGVFSWLYLPIGLLLGVFTAGFLTYISWLDLSWTAISFALAVVFIVFIQKGKERERTI